MKYTLLMNFKFSFYKCSNTKQIMKVQLISERNSEKKLNLICLPQWISHTALSTAIQLKR